MTHILSTRRRLVTPPEMTELNRAQSNGAESLRPSARPAWSLGRAQRGDVLAPTELALLRARSEAAVDSLLATLPEDWAAFASPALGGDEVSVVRLLVGPGGVFAVHTQLYEGQFAWVHRRRLFVIGHQRRTDLAVAGTSAQQLTVLLRGKVPLRTAVQPTVVVLGAGAGAGAGARAHSMWPTGRLVSGAGDPVTVLGAGALAGWLAARPQILRPVERMELAAVIDNPGTWGVRPTIVPGA